MSHHREHHRDHHREHHREHHHRMYGQQPPRTPPSSYRNIYSSSRSAVDPADNYYSDTSSRYYRSSSYSTDPYSYSDYAPSSTYSKRPSQALYSYSSLDAHMLGQSEAWLTSDSMAKRPKLKSACLPVYPQRPGEKDCDHYMLTRTCRFGETCKFDHPIWVPDGGIPDWKEVLLPPIASEFHPERPGELDCPFFLKTQKCKFGLNCKFNHPKDKLGTSEKTESSDLPERPSEPECTFYVKTGKCKFGSSCKFHHPKDIQIPSDGQEAPNKEQTKPAGNGISTVDKNEVRPFIFDPAPSFNSKGLPVRLGEDDCPFYLKTGSCKYAANCRYNHPDINDISPAALVGHSILASSIPNLTAGLVNPAGSILQSFQPSLTQSTFGAAQVIYPQRPGHTECGHYMKAGICKFGEKCKFHHPIDRSTPKLTLAGFPRREGAQNCSFYMKNGTCKYGATCMYDHPPPAEVMASSEKEKAEKAEKVETDEESN